MLTNRRTITPTPHADAVPAATELLDLIAAAGLEKRVPELRAAVDRAADILDGLSTVPTDDDGHEQALADLAADLAAGQVTTAQAAERAVVLQHIKANPGRVRNVVENAARIAVAPGLTALRARGVQLHADLGKQAATIATEAGRLAADVPDDVNDDARAFGLGDRGRKAWARLTELHDQLAAVQETVDVLRDHAVVPGPTTPNEAATADPHCAHFAEPWNLPTDRQIRDAHPARRLLLVLPARPAELTWQEYRDAEPRLGQEFRNIALRAVGLPTRELVHASATPVPAQPDPNDLASTDDAA